MHDNTLYVIVHGMQVGVGCRRAPADTIKYFTLKELKSCNPEQDLPPDNMEVLRYSEPTPRAYLFAAHINCLIVKSGMGTQKTTILRDHIRKEGYRSVIVVSFRRTFTDETLNRYGTDFKDYRKFPAKEDIRADKLVIQLESLWRLDIREWKPDLLVLDESECHCTGTAFKGRRESQEEKADSGKI